MVIMCRMGGALDECDVGAQQDVVAPVERERNGDRYVSATGSGLRSKLKEERERRVVEERGECGWLVVLVALRNRMWM